MYNTSGRVDTDIVACTGRGGEGREVGRARGREGQSRRKVNGRRRGKEKECKEESKKSGRR